MRVNFVILLLAVVFAIMGAEPLVPRAGSLYLSNGDIFSGELAGFDTKEGLQWKHPAAKASWLVAPESLARLELQSAVLPHGQRRHSAIVRLVNGDALPGDIVDLDAEHILLETWYAGRLKVPRFALRDLYFTAHGRVILEGAAAFTGWGGGVMGVQLGQDGEEIAGVLVNSIVANGPAEGAGVKPGDVVVSVDGKKFMKRDELIANIKSRAPGEKVLVEFRRGEEKIEHAIILAAIGWQVKNEALISSGEAGTIGRNINFPDAANIEFELNGSGLSSFAIALCTDNPASFSLGNAYTLNFSSGYAYLNRHERAGDQYSATTLDSPAQFKVAANDAPVQMSIRFDKRTQTIALILDGALVKQWRDPQGFVGKGKGLAFAATIQSQSRISNLRVTEWDGQLPEQLDAPVADTREDSIRLANRDMISGSVTAIHAGKATIKASFGEVAIPVERIGRIEFAAAKTLATIPAGLATGTLSGRNRLTFRLHSWRDGEAQIESPFFGKARFSGAAFSALEFGGK